MDLDFNLVFKGEVALDHDIGATRQKLAKAFNASDEKLAVLFSGKPVIVKKGLSSEDGIKLQHKLLQIGAITYLESSQPSTRNSPPAYSSATHPVKHRTSIDRVSIDSAARMPVAASLALAPIEAPVQIINDDQTDSSEPRQSKIKLSSFTFSSHLIFPLLLIFLSIALLVAFSPYPDYVLRKGFAVGGIFLFIGLRKLKA